MPKNLSYGLLPLAMEVEALFFCALKGIASLVESLVHFNISKLLIITKGKDLKTCFYANKSLSLHQLAERTLLFSCRCIIRVFSIDNL